MSQKIHTERINRVITFLENNLDSAVNVSQLAQIACYSEFHFQRVFHAFVNESIYAHRKRLLLERAVKQLLHTTKDITSIAFDCGYHDQTAFNKAFKKHFHHTPSEVRKSSIGLLNKQAKLNPTEMKTMQAKIKTLEEIKLISARATGAYADSAAQAWGQMMKFAYSNKLMKPHIKMIGISHDDPNVTQAGQIRYDACVDIDADISEHPELTRQTIQAGRFAVFLHRGPHNDLSQSYDWIFSQWLPESDHELRDVPCFEMYLNRDPRRTKPENLKTEIYIPIQ